MADEWVVLSLNEWQKMGRERFGDDVNTWRFRCPSCGFVQSRQDWLDLGMNPRQVDERVGFSCIGRWLRSDDTVKGFEPHRGAGCMYAGGLAPNISPFTVTISDGEERPTFSYDMTDD